MTMPLTKRAVHGLLAVLEAYKEYMEVLEESAGITKDNQSIRETHFRCDHTYMICDDIARLIKTKLLDEYDEEVGDDE